MMKKGTHMLAIMWLSALTFIASFIGVGVGFGLSTIMIPVLIMVYPVQPVLLLVGILHWFSNIWKIVLFRQGLLWKLIVTFGIPGIIATIIGSLFSLNESQRFLSQFLGILLIGYVLFIIFKPQFKIKKSMLYASIGGICSGFLAGIIGFRGAIRATFLSAFDLKKEAFISTGAAIALVIDTARVTTYWLGGTRITFIPTWSIILLLAISWISSLLARRFVEYIPQEKFRSVVIAFLFIIGIRLFFWPLI